MSPDDLTLVLDRYPAITRPIAEPIALGNAGGLSGCSLWRFDSGRGPLLARAWPSDGITLDQLQRIHDWLAIARTLPFVPVPIRDRSGRTIQRLAHRLWDVSPWMPGRAELGQPPDRPRVLAGFKALASFHQTLAGQSRVGPSPGLNLRLGELRALILRDFDVLEEAVAQAENGPAASSALRWLDLARRVAPNYHDRLKQVAGVPCRLQPCLRDVRPDHFLFEGEHLTGLIDFGAMRFDVVSGDLARLLSEWVEDDRWVRGEALQAYASACRLDDSEGTLIDVFEGSAALLGASHWIRWHYLEGRLFEDPLAVSRGIERSLERLVRHLAATLQ